MPIAPLYRLKPEYHKPRRAIHKSLELLADFEMLLLLRTERKNGYHFMKQTGLGKRNILLLDSVICIMETSKLFTIVR